MEDNVTVIQDNPAVGQNIPTFLLKLVNMLNDDSNHQYVDWNDGGTSFIVKDQVQFSKIVLPKYFKHNKFASFVRQLNMYGFRKITSLTQSGLNNEKEEIEFYHFLFIRGEEFLLENIKRKVNKPEESNRRHSEDVTKVLSDVKQMKGHQENVNTQLTELKQENEELWREVVNLRHKHSHQQKVVNKLIQFLVNLVHQHGMGVKRKLPLMIEDGSSGSTNYVPATKYSKPLLIDDEDVDQVPLAFEETSKPTVSFPPSVMPTSLNENIAPAGSGPYITEVTTPVQSTSRIYGNTSQQQLHNTIPVLIDTTLPGSQDNTIPATPAFDVDEYIDSTLNHPTIETNISEPSSSVTFPSDDFDGLVQPPTYNANQVAQNTQVPVTDQQQESLYYSSPQTSTVYNSPKSGSQNELTRYSPPRSPRLSPSDLTSHIDSMTNNLESIQDLLFNNDQVQLDYGLIQELFSTSPDIMPRSDDAPANSGSENIEGNELILHPGTSTSKYSQKDMENDLKELRNFM